jgi:hypothetical protein
LTAILLRNHKSKHTPLLSESRENSEMHTAKTSCKLRNNEAYYFSELYWVKLSAQYAETTRRRAQIWTNITTFQAVYVIVAREPSEAFRDGMVNGKGTGAALRAGSDGLCGRGSAYPCRRMSAGRRPMSGRFCRSGVGRPCPPESAQVGTCLAGCVDRVPERSDGVRAQPRR